MHSAAVTVARADGVERRHPAPDEPRELLRDEVVRVHAAVGPVGDPDARARPPSGAPRSRSPSCRRACASSRPASRRPPRARAPTRRRTGRPRSRCPCRRASRSPRRRASSRARRTGRRRGSRASRPRPSGRGPRRTGRSAPPPRPPPGSRPRTARAPPGTPPRVSTAPVPMHLMRSAPPIISRRTRSRTSAGDVTTPNRRSSGSRMSCARPTTSPPPQGAVMNAPAHCIRGPSASPPLIASRSAQSTNARNGPRSRTVVNPASTVTRAWRTPISASWAAEVVAPGTPAVWTSPMRWLWVSMSPGSDGEPGEVDDPRVRRAAPSSGPATASTRPSRTRIVACARYAPDSTSSRRPTRMATAPSASAKGGFRIAPSLAAYDGPMSLPVPPDHLPFTGDPRPTPSSRPTRSRS